MDRRTCTYINITVIVLTFCVIELRANSEVSVIFRLKNSVVLVDDLRIAGKDGAFKPHIVGEIQHYNAVRSSCTPKDKPSFRKVMQLLVFSI